MDRTANLLGALALAIADRTADAIAPPAGGSRLARLAATDAIALSALEQFLDNRSIDLLSRVLGLSHSGTVRLVDRLVDAGLVERAAGPDRRTAAVRLTDAGRRAAREVSAERGRVLEAALDALTPAERETLDELVGRILAGMVRAPGATRWMCRLCDLHACGRDAGQCPVAEEARRRYGGTSRPEPD